MTDRTVRMAAAAILLLAPTPQVQSAERPAAARPCPGNLPEGVRLPPQPGCDGGRTAEGKSHSDGFRDFGEGVRVRIDGRAATEMGARR